MGSRSNILLNSSRNCFQVVLICIACLASRDVSAQVFPVQSNLFITPPYTPQLSAYTTLGSQKLTLQINANDITLSDYQAKLRITIEGVGITIRTKPTAFFRPLLIQGGSPQTYYGEDLADYFLPQNLDFAGFSRRDFEKTGKLPEGIYRFTIEVLDYNRNTVVSNKAITTVWMILNDPPLLNLPRNNTKIILLDPTNIPFTWTSRHSGSPNAAFTTEYIFRLVEIWPLNRNPYDAFLTQQPLYETTTTQSQIIYTMAEPALIPGRRYAWQVQAVDMEGRDLFKNQGRSEVYVFQYGDPISQPENFRKEGGGETTISMRWEPPMNGEMPRKYRVRYKPVGGPNWYEEVTEARWLTLGQLRTNTTYELQVRSEGLSQVSDYTLSQRIKTDSVIAKNYSCGTDPQILKPTDSTPLFKLRPGDNFNCGDFTVLVAEVKGDNGTFTGIGWQTINIFNGAMIKVSFSGTINSKYQLTAGRVVSIQDPNSKMSNLMDEMKEIGEDKIDAIHARDTIISTPIVSYKVEGVIDSVFVNSDGMIVVQTASGDEVTYSPKKVGDGNKKSSDAMVTDSAGNTYTVSNGKVTSNGSTATQSVVNTISYTITFDKTSTQTFGFDKQEHATLEKNYDKTDVNGTSYTIPWKAVGVGATDKVKALSSQKRKDLSKETGFQSNFGPLPKLPGTDTEIELTVQGRTHQEVEEVTAYLNKKDANGKDIQETIGRLNVISYDKIIKRLVLVPVNDTPIPAGFGEAVIQQELNKVYGQAAVQWVVNVEPSLRSNFDANNDHALEYGTNALLSITSEMRTIVNDFINNGYTILPETYYLFLVPKSTEPGLTGYMPRRKQVGFLFADQLNTTNFIKTIGHELGHGAFRLEHTFPELPKTGNNLMDYSISGTHLHKHQWDYIHDPMGALGLWDEDSDAALSLPCLGLFDDCDDVLGLLNAIRKSYASTENIHGSVPYSAANRVLNAKSVRIENTEFSFISIQFTGPASQKYSIDPTKYSDYDETISSTFGGSIRQKGIAFTDGSFTLKILINESDEATTADRIEKLKNYLFSNESWSEQKIIIRLKRIRNNANRTVGALNIDNGTFSGYTLELPKGTDSECMSTCTQEKKDNGLCKRIMAGTYNFEYTTWSNKEWAVGHSLRIHEVPGRQGILIHRGVNAKIWSEGCILAMRNNPTTDQESTPAAQRQNEVDDSHDFCTEIAEYVLSRELEIKSKFNIDKVEKILIITDETEIED